MAVTIDSSVQKLDQIWYTRCPVPTASGLALNLGWLSEAFAADGIAVSVLQDAPDEFRRHHLDHELDGLVREGGNIPALNARGAGASSRLIGLTWIDEWQSIVVRPDSAITSPEQLLGARLAIPAWKQERGSSIWRGMAIAGFSGALRSVGLSLADARLVEVEDQGEGRLPPFEALLRGEVDAVYAKGAFAAEQSAAAGLVVGIDLDAFDDRRFRVNNGTPRPITVHQRLLDEHPELVVRFLVQTLRAAEWAALNLDGVRRILERETGSGPDGVSAAYRNDFHLSLHPTLSEDRLQYLDQQKALLWSHGFLPRDFDLDAWVAPEPLLEAQRILDASREDHHAG
jgi:ABC-type nitrate/sulfonate/bicarbonate transport system substrate-binding protein